MILNSHSALSQHVSAVWQACSRKRERERERDAPRLGLESKAPVPPLEPAPDRLALLVRARHAAVDVGLRHGLGALLVRQAGVVQVELGDDVVV